MNDDAIKSIGEIQELDLTGSRREGYCGASQVSQTVKPAPTHSPDLGYQTRIDWQI